MGLAKILTLNPWLLVSIFGAAFAGAAGHELAHYTVARSFRCERASIHLRRGETPLWAVWAWQPYVEFEVQIHRSSWVDRAVTLTPITTGLIALAIALATGWAPTSVWDAPLVVGWIVYTLLGGLEDYSIAVSRGGALVDWSLFTRQFVGGIGVWVVGLLVNHASVIAVSIENPALQLMVSEIMQHAAIAFMIGGIIVVGMAARNTDTIPEKSLLRTPVGDLV